MGAKKPFQELLLADEINRAAPKVQGALLEAMQERKVTIGDNTYRLPVPFLVIATQNPIEQSGTFELPEAQLDRFMLCHRLQYPTPVEEEEILTRKIDRVKDDVRNLEDGFEAEDLKVIVNAYKPESAKIHVYAKVLSPDDTDSFDDRGYIQLEQETANSVNSLNEDDFKEFLYRSAGDSIDYTDDNGTNYKKFKTFAIKLCLLSTNTLDVPKVKDLRAIALDE